MAMYMVKASYTGASWKALIDKPENREEEISKAAASFDVRIHNFFFAFGEQDVIVLLEAPDHNTLLAFLMMVAGSGAATGMQTTVLFTAAEAKTAMEKAKSAPPSYTLPGDSVDIAAIHNSPGYHRP